MAAETGSDQTNQITVGIIGAGQLAAFLCRAATSLGIRTIVVARDSGDVAAGYADMLLLESEQAWIERLVESADIVTFDKEDIAAEILAQLEAAQQRGLVRVAPGLATLRLLQNKASQKGWLLQHGFPTATFEVLDKVPTERGESLTLCTHLVGRLGMPFVVKRQRGGYDGLGVSVVREAQALPFAGDGVIAERYVSERREFATLVARSANGEVCTYEPFELIFDDAGNLLRKVLAPAALPAHALQQAIDLSKRVVSALEGVGMFAIEYFYEGGQWLINEISPRVHNAGHLTMEGHATSQFEQHLRAISGMPLGSVEQKQPAAMINLLCEPGMPAPDTPPALQADAEVCIHWYGKREPRPLRKLGHITATAGSLNKALSAAEKCCENLRHAHAG